MRRGVYKPCEVCGELVYRAPAHAHLRAFCSKEHWQEFIRGRPKTEQHRQALKETYRSGSRSPNRHSWARGGIREDLGHYVRSRWEANYARLLRFEGIEYVYEPPGLPCDFLLVGLNEVVEIKPDHRVHELVKFWELETQFKCTVIGNDEYFEFERLHSAAIQNWEYP